MVIMFHLNQAALLSTQLLLMHQLVAVLDNGPVSRRSMQVSSGKSVTLTCNASMANIMQINWTKGSSSLFAHVIFKNQTFSNLTSHRLRVDSNFPLNLHISNVQHNDTGLYRCTANSVNTVTTTEWNLTVSEELEAVWSPWYFPYILTCVLGFLLYCITSAVCLCSRKIQTKTPEQDLVSGNDCRTLTYVLFHVQQEGKVAPDQPQSCVENRMNLKQRLSSALGLTSVTFSLKLNEE
uniref:uncharacterized protein LOC124067633 isoform X2 n=1 Tax=Scatophagus argus TaxID=75038 RepID=UPI001ED808A6|nr:uncharacterized protein LOC124067633 isoform X2 [Scatophagus argus]